MMNRLRQQTCNSPLRGRRSCCCCSRPGNRPSRRTEAFLRGLRTTVGRQVPITIVLIGKPTSRTMLTSVDPDQLRIWQMKMQSLGDGQLAVQPLITP